jgi:hypothetical protein
MSRIENIGARWWRSFYGTCVLVALLFGLIEASSVLMERARDGVAGVWWEPLVNETTGPLALVALLPLIRWFDGLFPIRGDSWGLGLIAHVLFSVPVALIHVASFVAARTLLYPLFGGDYQLGELGFELIYEYRKSAVGYAVLLFALYSFRHYVQLRRLLDMPDAHQRGDDPEHEPARPAAPAALPAALPATAPADAAARPPATRRFLARRPQGRDRQCGRHPLRRGRRQLRGAAHRGRRAEAARDHQHPGAGARPLGLRARAPLLRGESRCCARGPALVPR